MTATTLPSMIVDEVEPRSSPSTLRFLAAPMLCEHVWEPHLWKVGRAYCPRCGSFARWLDDPRQEEPA